MRKKIGFVLAALLAAAFAVPAYGNGNVPYLGYTYDYWGFAVPSPAAYTPLLSIGAPDIDPALGLFKNPEAMYVDGDGLIYLLDTGNNRLVIFDRDLTLINVIDRFERDGQTDTFNEPCGVFVTGAGEIYIADTGNQRIVALDSGGAFLKQVSDPQYDTLEDRFVFAPLKVCVDPAGRVYAIVRNVYEGIMCFDSDGTFFGYYGTVKVNYTPLDLFWRQFSTAAQRARQKLFIPVEFASMDMDGDGFIYTTNIEQGDENKVKRLNPSGEDVLINYNTQVKINGDQRYRTIGSLGGPAVFRDIKTRGSGMYTALDATRGRLFTYDSEGNLLYIVGGTGNVMGMARNPVAVEILDNNMLVLDKARGELVYYEPTEYGRLINEAIALRFEGDESAAVEKWRQVIDLNGSYTLAYVGVGKALLAAGDNREAMTYLEKGMSVEYYSVAFRRYRNDLLKDNLRVVLTVAAAAVAAAVALLLYRNARRRRARLADEIAANTQRAERLRAKVKP